MSVDRVFSSRSADLEEDKVSTANKFGIAIHAVWFSEGDAEVRKD